MTGTNTLCYLVLQAATKKKSFIGLITGLNDKMNSFSFFEKTSFCISTKNLLRKKKTFFLSFKILYWVAHKGLLTFCFRYSSRDKVSETRACTIKHFCNWRLLKLVRENLKVVLAEILMWVWLFLWGNCGKFYFTFVFVHQNCVRIVQIIKLDQIPIHHLSN